MALPKAYRSFEDFEREEIRPGMRVGWSLDDLSTSTHEVDFDVDPFEAALEAAEAEEDLED
jgi:hypothetical protein